MTTRYPVPWVRIMTIVAKAAELKGLEPTDLLKRDRTWRVSYPRFGVIWVLRQCDFSLVTIAKHLNFKDHTSIHHAQRKAEWLRENDPQFYGYTNELLMFALTNHPLVSEAA